MRGGLGHDGNRRSGKSNVKLLHEIFLSFTIGVCKFFSMQKVCEIWH